MNKCARCIHSTNSDKCPWATEGKPVPGWDADPTVISPNQKFREESYYIRACPLFERGHNSPKYDEGDTHVLIAAVLEQAVEDWKALNYGRVESKRVCGQVIKSADLAEFFRSKEFAAMARYVTKVPLEVILSALRVPAEEAMT